MCQFGTGLAALRTAAAVEDHRTLVTIEAALQLLTGLEEEAERNRMPLKTLLQLMRDQLLISAIASRRN